jgi:hypothetical protein
MESLLTFLHFSEQYAADLHVLHSAASGALQKVHL